MLSLEAGVAPLQRSFSPAPYFAPQAGVGLWPSADCWLSGGCERGGLGQRVGRAAGQVRTPEGGGRGGGWNTGACLGETWARLLYYSTHVNYLFICAWVLGI